MLEINNDEFNELLDGKELFFIQIGANDGISVDPIHNLVKKNNWTGILFEPGKDAFGDLIKSSFTTKSVSKMN